MATCFCTDLSSLFGMTSRVHGLSQASIAGYILRLSAAQSGRLDQLTSLFRETMGKWQNPLRKTMQLHRAVMLLMLVTRMSVLQAPLLEETVDIVMLVFATFAL